MNFIGAFSGYSSNDIPACLAFYSEKLDITCTETMGGFNFTVNQQQVFVYPKEDHEPATYTVLNLVVANINEAIDVLVQKGVVFERYSNLPADQDDRGILRGKDAGMGPNIAWFKDPAGNILALIEE